MLTGEAEGRGHPRFLPRHRQRHSVGIVVCTGGGIAAAVQQEAHRTEGIGTEGTPRAAVLLPQHPQAIKVGVYPVIAGGIHGFLEDAAQGPRGVKQVVHGGGRLAIRQGVRVAVTTSVVEVFKGLCVPAHLMQSVSSVVLVGQGDVSLQVAVEVVAETAVGNLVRQIVGVSEGAHSRRGDAGTVAPQVVTIQVFVYRRAFGVMEKRIESGRI